MYYPHYLRSPAVDGVANNDPFFSSVVLLAVNDNQPNGTTTFADQSNSAHTLTNVGSPAYTNAQAPTGMTTVGDFTNSANYLSMTSSADWQYTGDLTVEAMVYMPTVVQYRNIFNVNSGSSTPGFFISSGTTNGILNFYNAADHALGTTTVGATAWHHLAFVRSGTTLLGFIDGVQTNGTSTLSGTLGGTTVPAQIASDTLASDHLRGYLCCLRVTKGVARYTSAFTPPTLPLPTQ